MTSLADLLNAYAAQIKLSGTGAGLPGTLISAGLNPDPLQSGLVDGVPGLSRTTVLLKMLRFNDDSLPPSGMSIADFLATAGQVLGGQAMPAISVPLVGPSLPLAPAVESLPSLGTSTAKASDILSGVPGIVGVIESGATGPLPLQVSLNWTFAISGPAGVTVPGDVTMSNSPASQLTIVPPLIFVDVGTDVQFQMTITVTGQVSIANSNPPISVPITPSPLTVPFLGIAVPRFLGLFTWPRYGSKPAAGRSDANQNSVLLMLPADSPFSDKDSLMAAMNSVQSTVGPVLSLLSVPLPAGTVAPFAPPAVTIQQLNALLAGISAPTAILSTVGTDYAPVTVRKATPSPDSPTRGGLSDITNIYWHYWFPDGHDAYHDNAQSFLWFAPPQSQVVIFRDTAFRSDEGNLDQHGKMTLTTGDTCLAGITDFRPAPDGIDPILSPAVAGLAAASADRAGWFTNEHPPTSENDWAWTDSFEFL